MGIIHKITKLYADFEFLKEPERFYHGFVLGLIVDLAEKYRITSNRESGFGRYDVVMEPLKENLDAKVFFPLAFLVFTSEIGYTKE